MFIILLNSMSTCEKPSSGIENLWNALDSIKTSLFSLEMETWIDFFKKAWDFIGNLFSFNSANKQKTGSIRSQNQFEKSDNTKWLRVSYAWDYIKSWWTFYSPSKWICKRNKYRQVCSTWSYNVLRLLWLHKVSNSLQVDLNWSILTKMWLKYIGEVNPKNPWQNWYKPQNWDTAVWPKFKKKSWKITQHQATYINWHWVSDNIQNQMSCYTNEPNEPMCKVYRYFW